MAVLHFWPTNTASPVGGTMSETDPSPGAEVAITPVTGWIGGTGSTLRSKLAYLVERASTTFDASTYPNGTIDTATGDTIRSANIYTGSFPAGGNWAFWLNVRPTTATGCAGRAYFRLFRGSNANGSGATQLTSSALQGSIVTLSSTTVSVTSNASSTTLGDVTLINEYLFIQIAWERTGAGGMTTSDINLRTGNGAAGTILDTPDFTPSAPPALPELIQQPMFPARTRY